MFDINHSTDQAQHNSNGARYSSVDGRRADGSFIIDPKILEDLKKSGLTPADIQIRSETRKSLTEKFGRRTANRLRVGPAYAILYPGTNYERTKFLDGCPVDETAPADEQPAGDQSRKKKRLPKYKGLIGWSPSPVYFPAAIDRKKVLADPRERIYIVESEKAACLLAKHGLPAVAIGGVTGYTAHKQGFHVLTPDLLGIVTAGRPIVVAFDSDKATKPQVLAAEANLLRTIDARGAVAYAVDIPAPLDGRDKNGPDDFIVERDIAAFRALEPKRPSELVEIHALADTYGYVELQDKMIRLSDVQLFSEQHFHRLEAQRKVRIASARGSREAQASEVFMTSHLRPNFKNITYWPGRPRILPDGCVNRWSRTYPEIKGNVGPYLRLRDFIFKDSEPWLAHAVECLFAYKYQNSGEKLPLSFFLFSDTQGSGKSAYILAACAAWGSGMLPEDPRNNFRKVSPRELDSTFNGHWAGACEMVLGDELTTRDNFVLDNERLKDMVSRRQMTIEDKHIKAYGGFDFMLYSLTSNSPRSIRINFRDRRMLCVHAPEEKPSQGLLQDVYAWIFKDPTSGPAMAYYWATFDYGNFNPFDEQGAPMTRAKEEVIRANAHAVDEELELLLSTLRLPEDKIKQAKCLPGLHSKIACCDLFSVQDFEEHFSARTAPGGSLYKSQVSSNYIREVLKRYGARELSGTLQPPGRSTVRVLAIRNQAKWLAVREGSEGHRACVEEYLVGHPERQDSKFSGGN